MNAAAAGLQEITRLLRCADSPANSIVAGAVTGSVLAGVQRKENVSRSPAIKCCAMPQRQFPHAGGKAVTIPAAAVCGAAAGFSHLLWLQAQPEWRLRVWLVQQGLLEDDREPTGGALTTMAVVPDLAPCAVQVSSGGLHFKPPTNSSLGMQQSGTLRGSSPAAKP